jgi:Flp pilus assembly protein TadG
MRRAHRLTGRRRDTAELPSRTARCARGQATVEFALVIPFVALLLLAIVQTALVARDFVRVAHASREAARAAAVDPDGSRARDAVHHLLGDGDVTITRGGSGGIGDPVTATVRYRSKTDLPIVGALFPDIDITDDTTMRAERT